MEKCHQTSDTADCNPTHYEWNKEMKQPVSNKVSKTLKNSSTFYNLFLLKNVKYKVTFTEVHIEPNQISTMEIFLKTVNGL